MFAGPTWVGKEALEGDGVLSVHQPEVGPPLGQAKLHHGPRTASHRNAYLNKKGCRIKIRHSTNKKNHSRAEKRIN
jgi:hypothetical protein